MIVLLMAVHFLCYFITIVYIRSEIAESHRFCDRVQDAYTMRCCPQVHGVIYDTIDFVKGILFTEVNSGTDNPVSFTISTHETMSIYEMIGKSKD